MPIPTRADRIGRSGFSSVHVGSGREDADGFVLGIGIGIGIENSQGRIGFDPDTPRQPRALQSRGPRPGGPSDDSPARERWVPSLHQHPAPAGRQIPRFFTHRTATPHSNGFLTPASLKTQRRQDNHRLALIPSPLLRLCWALAPPTPTALRPPAQGGPRNEAYPGTTSLTPIQPQRGCGRTAQTVPPSP